MESWVFLLVGGLGAVGAALTIGTLAAIVQYRRHGTLPGQDEDAPPPGPDVERRLWVRVVIGVVVAAVCFMVLVEQGLVAGPLLG